MPLPKWVETLTVVPEYLHVEITERVSIPVGVKRKKTKNNRAEVPWDYSLLIPLLDELEIGEEIQVDYDIKSTLVKHRVNSFIAEWNSKMFPKKLGRRNSIEGRFLIRIA